MATPRTRVRDDVLRLRALDVLGALGDELARELLAWGDVLVEHDVSSWDGSTGHVRGHRVVVVVEAALEARYAASHASRDALVAALAGAMAARDNETVVDVDVVAGSPARASSGPYRGPAR